jgi:hypothetical protein
MPGQPVRIGPFVGGMNTYNDSTSIADNEAADLVNFDIDLDGSLIQRPPLVTGSITATEKGHVIGIYRSITGIVYMIFAYDTSVRALDTTTGTWTTIAAVTATACVQYNDKLYIVQKPSGVTQGGQKWDPVGGATAVAAMPRGYSACIYKERMFIAASKNADETSINRVKFSNPANPEVWSGTDTFDVSAGDGQDIMRILVFDSSIVIFKTDSTFIYAYESQPTKGQVQMVSNTVGLNNSYSVVEYENNLFVMHETKVYRVSNWQWEHANIKVPFEYRNSFSLSPENSSSVSVVGNRLVCRYYDNYYILGLKTGAWTTWAFGSRENHVVNPSFEVNNSNWMIVPGQATITRDTTKFKNGVASGRLDTIIGSTNPYTTTGTLNIPAAPEDIWTGSAYVTGVGGASVQILATDGSSTLQTFSGDQVTLDGTWKRIFATSGPLPAGTTNIRIRVLQHDVSAARSLWIDSILGEPVDQVYPYIDTAIAYTPSEFIGNPNINPVSGITTYYAASYAVANLYRYEFRDAYSTESEVIFCSLVTKTYDYGVPYGFKRMYWWGADILSKSKVSFKVTPIAYSTPVTWGQLAAQTFANYLTWGRPLEMSIDVSDTASGANPSYYRTFLKLLKGLRFRQVQFTLESTSDGTTDTGPLRVFSLTSFVDNKEIVSKKVS